MNWDWWKKAWNLPHDENGVLRVVISPIPEWMQAKARRRIEAAKMILDIFGKV